MFNDLMAYFGDGDLTYVVDIPAKLKGESIVQTVAILMEAWKRNQFLFKGIDLTPSSYTFDESTRILEITFNIPDEQAIIPDDGSISLNTFRRKINRAVDEKVLYRIRGNLKTTFIVDEDTLDYHKTEIIYSEG